MSEQLPTFQRKAVAWRDLAELHRTIPGNMMRAELKYVLTLCMPLLVTLAFVCIGWVVEWVQ